MRLIMIRSRRRSKVVTQLTKLMIGVQILNPKTLMENTSAVNSIQTKIACKLKDNMTIGVVKM